jgi:hypothetical protein
MQIRVEQARNRIYVRFRFRLSWLFRISRRDARGISEPLLFSLHEIVGDLMIGNSIPALYPSFRRTGEGGGGRGGDASADATIKRDESQVQPRAR